MAQKFPENIFVCYSRSDYEKVNIIVNALKRRGFAVWHDEQGNHIAMNEEWQAAINRQIDNSPVFLACLTDESIERLEVIRELQRAIAAGKRILCVFLKKTSLRYLDEPTRQALSTRQALFIPAREGITAAHLDYLAQALTSQPEAAVEPGQTFSDWINDIRTTAYIYEGGNPQGVTVPEPDRFLSDDRQAGSVAYTYYQIEADDISPAAVMVMELDNQWYPRSMLAGLTAHSDDASVRAARIALDGQRQALQQNALIAALFHARQVMINRAFLQNSALFLAIYAGSPQTGTGSDQTSQEQPDLAALKYLLANGSIVVVLYTEEHPAATARQAFTPADQAAWIRLCRETAPCALRQDWQGPLANQKSISKKLSQPFQAFCLTAGEDPYLVQNLADFLAIQPEDRPAFQHELDQVQAAAIAWRAARQIPYTRSAFYEQFVVRQSPDPAEQKRLIDQCVIDPDKPFAPGLKQMIDLQYNVNFAEAFNCDYLQPKDTLPATLLEAIYQRRNVHELSLDSLLFAIDEFDAGALAGWVDMPLLQTMTLADVRQVREKCASWEPYIAAHEAALARIYRWSMDFASISSRLAHYYRLLAEMRSLASGRGIEFVRMSRAVSVIYRLGTRLICTIYRYDEKTRQVEQLYYQNNLTVDPFSAAITISFIFADALSAATRSGIAAEIKLFSGITTSSAADFHGGLVTFLEKRGFRPVVADAAVYL